MKKAVLGLCIVCLVVDLILSFIGRQYMDAVKDIAMILLAIMMSTLFFKKKRNRGLINQCHYVNMIKKSQY